MRFPRPLSCLVLALVLSALLPARAPAVGEAGFAFMKVGVGARAMGMGSAYVAEAGDPTAVYWNPAGLGGLERTQITFMHSEWIQDFRQDFAAVAAPAFRDGAGGFAVGLSTFYADEFERRSDTGELLGHFGFNDILATGSLAYPLSTSLTGGLSVKFIREMIDQEVASSVAFDLGARLAVPRTSLVLAGAVQSLGSKPKFIEESFDLPTMLRLGASQKWGIAGWSSDALLSAEFRQTKGEDSKLHVGGEWLYRKTVALRAGYKMGYDEETATFGLGLAHNRFAFDYALVPLSSDLGTTHFFSLTASL
jgi:hypothetical protein